jgi:hypothetical protein
MQVVFGECELAVGDEPNKEAAVAAALSPPAHAEATKPAAAAKPGPTSGDADEAAKRRHKPGTQPPPSPT